VGVTLIFCAEHLRDTLFIRPHPAVWRFFTGLGVVYTAFLTFLLFQNIATVRALMPHLDSRVTGQPLPERNYASDCSLTWEAMKASPRHHTQCASVTAGWWYSATSRSLPALACAAQDTLIDEFVIAHSVGWAFKHMMIRDVRISLVLSTLWEFVEYTFEFVQPNFAECW